MNPDGTAALGVAALFLLGNAGILTYAWRQGMLTHAGVFYLLWGIAMLVLPPGGPHWFLLAVWLAVAVRAGRLLVLLQQERVGR